MQIDGKTIDTVWHKIVDKGLSLLILIAVIWFMSKVVSRLDDRVEANKQQLDKYIYEDRIKMMTIIQNNTEAMNRFVELQLKDQAYHNK